MILGREDLVDVARLGEERGYLMSSSLGQGKTGSHRDDREGP